MIHTVARAALAILTAAVLLSATPVAAAAETTPVYVFLYRPGPAWKPGVPLEQQGLKAHGAYMKQLQDEGRTYGAGRLLNADGGMVVLRAADIEEARRLMAADPAVAAGIFTGELLVWQPRFGAGEPLPLADR